MSDVTVIDFDDLTPEEKEAERKAKHERLVEWNRKEQAVWVNKNKHLILKNGGPTMLYEYLEWIEWLDSIGKHNEFDFIEFLMKHSNDKGLGELEFYRMIFASAPDAPGFLHRRYRIATQTNAPVPESYTGSKPMHRRGEGFITPAERDISKLAKLRKEAELGLSLSRRFKEIDDKEDQRRRDEPLLKEATLEQVEARLKELRQDDAYLLAEKIKAFTESLAELTKEVERLK